MNIQQELQKLADPKRAEGEKKYLKSSLEHYGVTSPQLDTLTKQWLKEHIHLTIDEVIKATNQLWASKWHEERSLGSNILNSRKKELTLRHLPHIEHMVRTSTGWAHLDSIAANLVGALYELNPAKIANVFRRWIDGNNFWVRRAAILGQLIPLREGRGDMVLFTELAVPHLGEKEFFIRKAIGWVLRERSKKFPQDTLAFVQKYGSQMSGLTYREATRRLPDDLKTKLTKI